MQFLAPKKNQTIWDPAIGDDGSAAGSGYRLQQGIGPREGWVTVKLAGGKAPRWMVSGTHSNNWVLASFRRRHQKIRVSKTHQLRELVVEMPFTGFIHFRWLFGTSEPSTVLVFAELKT